MPRRVTEEEHWDDDEDDWDAEDDDGDDEAATIACPYCKRQIHEDSQRCPHCENNISQEDAPPSRKPWWIIAGTILGLYVVYRWIVG